MLRLLRNGPLVSLLMAVSPCGADVSHLIGGYWGQDGPGPVVAEITPVFSGTSPQHQLRALARIIHGPYSRAGKEALSGLGCGVGTDREPTSRLGETREQPRAPQEAGWRAGWLSALFRKFGDV